MGKKVLISFLGTGPLEPKEKRTYKTVRYSLDGKNLGDFPFVSAALKKYYQIDKVLLIGTAHSMWEEVYRWYNEESGLAFDENVWLEIAEACEKANYKSDLFIPHQDNVEKAIGKESKVILIKYGINEQEIMENTNIILGLQQYLNSGDSLIVDITHSFRSLPMFMMNLLIYLRNVSRKKISISHIHYGMLEMSKEIGFAPIIDLKTMMDVNDWITGAYSFSEFGNAYKISDLIETEDKSVSTLLHEFSNLMNLNHLFAIQTISQRLGAVKNKRYKTSVPELTINPIVESFINEFDVKGGKHSLFQLKVARWQLDHRKYAQAMLTVQESMITFVCEQNKLAWDEFDNRELAKKALKNYLEARKLKCEWELKQIYKRLRPLRNSTAHSIETDDNVQSMLRILADSVLKLETIIK